MPSRPSKAHTVDLIQSVSPCAGGVSLKTSPQPLNGAHPDGAVGPPEYAIPYIDPDRSISGFPNGPWAAALPLKVCNLLYVHSPFPARGGVNS